MRLAPMIERFDVALTSFEADVRSGKAAVRVVNKNDSGHGGGGGAFGWETVAALFLLVTLRALPRVARTARTAGAA